MLSKQSLIKVTNRSRGNVGYTIPDLGNLHRNFESNQTKEIEMDELRKLSYSRGGRMLLKHHLIIDNKEALEELLGSVEPEYYYTDKEITELLQNGTIDQLTDCLNFAPAGVIELIKNLAVTLEINDIKKRELILEKTGFNVTNAIKLSKDDENINKKVNKNDKRKTSPITIKEKPIKYRIISEQA